MIKMVIVVRTDLNMRKGKIASQVAHSVLKIFLDRIRLILPNDVIDSNTFSYTRFTPAMRQWIDWEDGQPGFTKIVVGCDNEQELYIIQEKAKEAGIPHALIRDNGATEFHGVITPTCICLGPDDADKIDLITKNYKLL